MRVRADGAICAVDVRCAFVFEQISPLVPAKPSMRRARDKGVNRPMDKSAACWPVLRDSQTSALKRSAPKPNGGETEATGLRVIQSLRLRAQLSNFHVGEPRSTAERPRDER